MSILRYIIPNIAIDFGTANALAAVRGKGIVLREPNIAAVSARGGTREVLAVGNEALEMLGRSPGNVNIVYAMRNGVIADAEIAQTMLKGYMEAAVGHRIGPLGARLVLSLPMCVSNVEKHALEEAAKNAGAREVRVLDEPLAAALGAGLPVYEAVGSMVVDVGAGTTDVAVLAFGGIAAHASVRTGGTHIDATIADYMRRQYGLLIGERMAEEVKIKVGSALLREGAVASVFGRMLESGLPMQIEVSANEIGHAITPVVRSIVQAVTDTLAQTPPELAGDLFRTGITLTGGGALLDGLARFIEREVKIKVSIAPDPLECVVIGALKALDEDFSAHDSRKHAQQASV